MKPDSLSGDHKRPRINRLTYTPISHGGFGLLNLFLPCGMPKISQLAHTTTIGPTPQWVVIKALSCSWIPSRLHPSILCPTLSYLHAVWDRRRARMPLSPHTPLAPVLNNPEFPPQLGPHHFQWWTNKGFLTKDFLDGDKPYILAHFQDALKMPFTEKFSYNQLTSYICTKFCSLNSPLTSLKISCRWRDLVKSLIYTIYTLLTDLTCKLPYMKLWEQDLMFPEL